MTKKSCAACKIEISSGAFITIGSEDFHQDCFKCFKCSEAISGGYNKKDDKFYCAKCYEDAFAEHCAACNKVLQGSVVVFDGKNYHKECLVCSKCKSPLTSK